MKYTKRRWHDVLLGGLIASLILGLTVSGLAASGSRDVEITYDNIALEVNGQAVTLRDGDGRRLEPFVMNGTVYLPARALGETLGMQVGWNNKTSTVTMSGIAYTPDSADYIGIAAAKSAALKHAGLKASGVTFTKAKLDWDDGRMTYDVEFYSGGVEYDYELDAITGEIRGVDLDHNDWDDSRHDDWDDDWDDDDDDDDWGGNHGSTGNYIGLERARALAQAKAPNARLTSCQLDWDDGRAVYEGELKDGAMEYEFEIDALTGSFLEWDADYDD